MEIEVTLTDVEKKIVYNALKFFENEISKTLSSFTCFSTVESELFDALYAVIRLANKFEDD